MPPTPAFESLQKHDVDISANYYAMDKAAMLHLPGGAAISKCHVDSVRCFVLPKPTSMKVAAAPNTWAVTQPPPAIIFPKVVDFIDEREKCVAVFWRGVDRDGEPWIVCLRPPFDADKMLSDKSYAAIKLRQVKSFSTILNESGGSLLTYMNKFYKESDVFKMQKLPNVAAVHSFAHKDNKRMFVGSMQQALKELELRIRRSQNTTRVSQKPPSSEAGKEDNQAELDKLREELKFKDDLAARLDLLVPVMELPFRQRFLVLDSADWESKLTELCPACSVAPHCVHIHTIFTLHISFVWRRCHGHPNKGAIMEELLGLGGKEKVTGVLSGKGEGDDCPTSAVKPPPKPATDVSSPAAEAGTTGGTNSNKDDEEEEEEFEDLDEKPEQQDSTASAKRVQPGRNRAKPVRLDSSPKLQTKKAKNDRVIALDDDDDEHEGTPQVKKEKGVGRGQKRGPRGLDGQPMQYRKRAAGTAGAAGKQRIKVEGSNPPNLDDAGIGWLAYIVCLCASFGRLAHLLF